MDNEEIRSSGLITTDIEQKLRDIKEMQKEVTDKQRKEAKEKVIDKLNTVISGKKKKMVFSYNTSTPEVEHAVGERWTEDGKEWEQYSWGKGRIPLIDRNELTREGFLMPHTCPKCNNIMKHWLDKKMWPLHRMCFSCVAEYETNLRIKGEYKGYEDERVKANMKAFYRDALTSIDDFINSLESTTVNEFGDIEETTRIDKDEMKRLLITDLDAVKKEFQEYFGEPIDAENNDVVENNTRNENNG